MSKTNTWLLIVLMVLGLWQNPPSLAKETSSADPYPAVKVSSSFSRGVQTILGFNRLAVWVASTFLEHELHQQFKGPLSIKIKPYSGFDLVAGKMKQVQVKGHHLVFDQLLPIHELMVTTQPETPVFINLKQKNPKLLRPVKASLHITLSQTNLNEMFTTPKGKEQLAKIKFPLPPLGTQALELWTPRILFLPQGRVSFEAFLQVPGAPRDQGIPLKAIGRLAVDEKKSSLKLAELKLESEGTTIPPTMTAFIEQTFGKLVDFSSVKLEGHRVQIQLAQPVMKHEILTLTGTATVVPKPQALVKSKNQTGR